MKTKTVFKLLEEVNGRYYSWSPPSECEQEYFTDKINRPRIRGSGMFVFDTFAAAVGFDIFSGRTRAIFKCEATGVRKRKFRLDILVGTSVVRSFWKDYRKFIYSNLRRDVRPSVFVCETLRLIKRVGS